MKSKQNINAKNRRRTAQKYWSQTWCRWWGDMHFVRHMAWICMDLHVWGEFAHVRWRSLSSVITRVGIVGFDLKPPPEWTPKASIWSAKYSSMIVITFAPIPISYTRMEYMSWRSVQYERLWVYVYVPQLAIFISFGRKTVFYIFFSEPERTMGLKSTWINTHVSPLVVINNNNTSIPQLIHNIWLLWE